MRRDYQYDLLADGLAIPVPPVWGKDNNPHQWWSINDYEILCAAYRQEVELFLKSFLPYLLKGDKEADPTTPQKSKPHFPSISEIPTLRKPRGVSFLQAPLISSITSSTRLGAIIEATSTAPKENTGKQDHPWKPWNTPEKDSDDPFNTSDLSEEEISTYQRPKGPSKPPSDSSDSEGSESNKPPKIPLRSLKRPPSNPIKLKEEAAVKTYHFNMKLKPETVPTWDGNENTLARWVEKVGQLADTSPDIFQELGKVVPRRFTNSAESSQESQTYGTGLGNA
jgi:hypothetical protein